MNGLTRFLDWLDEAAAGFIRLAYLAAGITAVALYFGAGHLPSFIEEPLNGALPWTLAAAVETHTYITARRVRAAWQEKNWAALKVNLAILGGLLLFSAWNQLNYLAETWQPPVGALPLPPAVAYLVRALIVPAAFMAAAFLAPMAEPVTAQIEAEARATLHDVFRIARKQRRRLLKTAERDGRDMTGALVELVPDPETRRIISHAYGAIGAPVAPLRMVDAQPQIAEPTQAPAEAQAGASTARSKPSHKPPTGPGTPVSASKRRKSGVKRPGTPRVVALRSMPAEERIRQVVAERPSISVRALARKAGVSESTASKHLRVIAAEVTAAQQNDQSIDQAVQ